MIDLHCHIIFGVDDGPINETESLAMMKKAVEDGITTIVATPHHLNERYVNEREQILPRVKQLNELARVNNLNLRIVPGQEVRLYHDIVADYLKKKIVTIGDNTQYLLVELPFHFLPSSTAYIFSQLQNEGLTPIIAHPERNAGFMDQPEKLIELVENGVLTQLTASSIVGDFGKKVQALCYQMIEANAVHVIASDAHHVTNRSFKMQEALHLLKKRYGAAYPHALLKNAESILANKKCTSFNTIPPQIKAKRFFDRFKKS